MKLGGGLGAIITFTISSVGNQNDVSPIDKCRIGFFRIFQERQKTDLLSYAYTLEETY